MLGGFIRLGLFECRRCARLVGIGERALAMIVQHIGQAAVAPAAEWQVFPSDAFGPAVGVEISDKRLAHVVSAALVHNIASTALL